MVLSYCTLTPPSTPLECETVTTDLDLWQEMKKKDTLRQLKQHNAKLKSDTTGTTAARTHE